MPDVKTNISAYDKVVKIVTNNDSHVHDSKDVKTNNKTLHEKETSKTYRLYFKHTCFDLLCCVFYSLVI